MEDINHYIKKERFKILIFRNVLILSIIMFIIILIIFEKKYSLNVLGNNMEKLVKSYYLLSVLLIDFLVIIYSLMYFIKSNRAYKKLLIDKQFMEQQDVQIVKKNKILELKSQYNNLRLYIILELSYVFMYMALVINFYNICWHLFLVLIVVYIFLIVKKIILIKKISLDLKE